MPALQDVYEQGLYVVLGDDSKSPIAKFGGWPVDPGHDNVFTYEEVQDSDHEWFGIVDTEIKNFRLFIVDIDTYEFDENTFKNLNFGTELNRAPVVRSQSGGIHVYVNLVGDEPPPTSINHVDRKGPAAKGYAVAPFTDKYEIERDSDIPSVSTAELLETDLFKFESGETGEGYYDPSPTPCWYEANDAGSDLAKQIELGTDIYQILDEANFPEDERVPAPDWLHGSKSSTGSNFMVDTGSETFRCWRHGKTGTGGHLAAIKRGELECDEIGHTDFESGPSCDDMREAGFCPGCPRDKPSF